MNDELDAMRYTAIQATRVWGADVVRWHSCASRKLRLSGDTTDAHQARCAQLLIALNPDADSHLIKLVLHHDIGEFEIGDVHSLAKRASPKLSKLLNKLERDVRDDMGVLYEPRDAEDETWLHFVDLLDAWMWATRVDPDYLADDGWAAGFDKLHSMALALRIGPMLNYLLNMPAYGTREDE